MSENHNSDFSESPTTCEALHLHAVATRARNYWFGRPCTFCTYFLRAILPSPCATRIIRSSCGGGPTHCFRPEGSQPAEENRAHGHSRRASCPGRPTAYSHVLHELDGCGRATGGCVPRPPRPTRCRRRVDEGPTGGAGMDKAVGDRRRPPRQPTSDGRRSPNGTAWRCAAQPQPGATEPRSGSPGRAGAPHSRSDARGRSPWSDGHFSPVEASHPASIEASPLDS